MKHIKRVTVAKAQQSDLCTDICGIIMKIPNCIGDFVSTAVGAFNTLFNCIVAPTS